MKNEIAERHGWMQNTRGEWVKKEYLELGKRQGFMVKGVPLSEVLRIAKHDEEFIKLMRDE